MKTKQARQAAITRIANLFSLVPPFRIVAAGSLWSWPQPVVGPGLTLCSYLPPREMDWVEIDLPDGMIELRPHLNDPELVAKEEELLQSPQCDGVTAASGPVMAGMDHATYPDITHHR
jgi:hypothetical protein